MWDIAKKSFGFVLTFKGQIEAKEMLEWVDASRRHLKDSLPDNWGVAVDMRELQPLSPAAQGSMVEGQKLYKARGMKRSAVVLKDAITTMQFRRLAKESGIDAWERYINVENVPAWQAAAKAWITDSVEPPR